MFSTIININNNIMAKRTDALGICVLVKEKKKTLFGKI